MDQENPKGNADVVEGMRPELEHMAKEIGWTGTLEALADKILAEGQVNVEKIFDQLIDEKGRTIVDQRGLATAMAMALGSAAIVLGMDPLTLCQTLMRSAAKTYAVGLARIQAMTVAKGDA